MRCGSYGLFLFRVLAFVSNEFAGVRVAHGSSKTKHKFEVVQRSGAGLIGSLLHSLLFGVCIPAESTAA
jgi:hypothetical protein